MNETLKDQRDWDVPVTNMSGVETVKWGALKDAFDKVCDPVNWKNPIKKNFPNGTITPYEVALTCEAINFFAGGQVNIIFRGKEDGITFEAPGYYALIGA